MGVSPVAAEPLGGVHRELWEAVRDEIRTLIISGVFAPGERLVEAALAERFAVSRGPVRTALAELERVGLARSVPRRGMQVATFTRADIDELFDVISALEAIAAREAAERASADQVSLLFELLVELDRAQNDGDQAGAVEADLELHRELVTASGNRRLLLLWSQISEEIRFVIAVTQRALPEVEWARYNRPIIDAVASRDADQAQAAVISCFTVAHNEMRALSAEAFDLCTGRTKTAATG
jgi:DNA-binding GntR family transcriptional regulator